MSKKILLYVQGAKRFSTGPGNGIKTHRRIGRNLGKASFGPGFEVGDGKSKNYEEFSFDPKRSLDKSMRMRVHAPEDNPMNGVFGRSECSLDTIPDHCLANCLLCLAGQRPVAVYTSHWDTNPNFDAFLAMARTGKVMMDTVNYITPKDNKGNPLTDKQGNPIRIPLLNTLQTNKSRRNALGQISPMNLKADFEYADTVDAELNHNVKYTWGCGIPTKEIATALLPDYNGFAALANQFFDYSKTDFLKAIRILRRLYRNGNQAVVQFVDSHDDYVKAERDRVYFHDVVYHILKTGNPSIGGGATVEIRNIIAPKSSFPSTEERDLARMLFPNISKGIAKYVGYNARVIVEVTDEVFDAIRNNWCVATLESGLVTDIRVVGEDSEEYDSWFPVAI